MQRGVSAEAREAIPGIFQTIATAMSLLLVQPLLLVLPLLVDFYLWVGVRISPERVLAPVAELLATQSGLDAAALAEAVRQMGRDGNLTDLIGWFIPSLIGSLGAEALSVPWPRPVVDPGGTSGVVLWVLVFIAAGALLLMTLQVMMARVVRERPAVGRAVIRAVGVASVRYAGFLLLLVPVVLMTVMAGSLAASILAMIDVFLASLVVMGMLMVMLIGAILLTFVVDAIALAEVGPIRAVELSVGVVRRYPLGAVGLLLVTGISLVTLPELARRVLVESMTGVVLAILLYAFVATGLALARMQFFYDRLRQWRPDQVPSLG